MKCIRCTSRYLLAVVSLRPMRCWTDFSHSSTNGLRPVKSRRLAKTDPPPHLASPPTVNLKTSDKLRISATCTAQGAPLASVCVPGPEGTTAFTIGKTSDFVSYDIPAFLARCNAIEPGWGGGSTIGGAPRKEGGLRSGLTRKQVEELLLAGVSVVTTDSTLSSVKVC